MMELSNVGLGVISKSVWLVLDSHSKEEEFEEFMSSQSIGWWTILPANTAPTSSTATPTSKTMLLVTMILVLVLQQLVVVYIERR